jgi:hypothetical protein
MEARLGQFVFLGLFDHPPAAHEGDLLATEPFGHLVSLRTDRLGVLRVTAEDLDQYGLARLVAQKPHRDLPTGIYPSEFRRNIR